MKFYRVTIRSEEAGHCGYSFHTSKRDADSAAATWRENAPGPDRDHYATVEPIEVTPTKAGILDALNRYASHNDNG